MNRPDTKLCVGKNIIGAIKSEIIFGALLKYHFSCDSNIGLLSIAPHLVIALPTFGWQKF